MLLVGATSATRLLLDVRALEMSSDCLMCVSALLVFENCNFQLFLTGHIICQEWVVSFPSLSFTKYSLSLVSKLPHSIIQVKKSLKRKSESR